MSQSGWFVSIKTIKQVFICCCKQCVCHFQTIIMSRNQGRRPQRATADVADTKYLGWPRSGSNRRSPSLAHKHVHNVMTIALSEAPPTLGQSSTSGVGFMRSPGHLFTATVFSVIFRNHAGVSARPLIRDNSSELSTCNGGYTRRTPTPTSEPKQSVPPAWSLLKVSSW